MSQTMNGQPTRSAAMGPPPVTAAQTVARRTTPQQQYAPAPEAAMPNISVGFGNLQSWEFTGRVARGLAQSTLVPEQYRQWTVDKKKKGDGAEEWKENPSAIPNCIVALNMAKRLNADVLMVMQNLYIVEGRPSWSAQFVIAAINSCGRFTSLQYRLVQGEMIDASYVEVKWQDNGRGGRERVENIKTVKVRSMSCVAFAKDRATGEILESPEITMEMAVAEGWYGKNGSKWQTMAPVMIRYRSASFFGRLYAPEILMGLRTDDETREIIDAEREMDGSWSVPNETGRVEPDLQDVNSTAEEVQSEADTATSDQQTSTTQHDPETGEITQEVQQQEGKVYEVFDTQLGRARPATPEETLELQQEERAASDQAAMDAEALRHEQEHQRSRMRGRQKPPQDDGGLPLAGGK